MGLEWIDLRRGEGVSSLQVGPDSLIVTGNLPHGIDIAPRSIADARRLRAWLAEWIERNGDDDGEHVPEPGPELAHDCGRTDDGGRPLAPDVKGCGGCGAEWCERCDPSPGPLCHTCHGRGHSTAPIREGDPA